MINQYISHSYGTGKLKVLSMYVAVVIGNEIGTKQKIYYWVSSKFTLVIVFIENS